MTKNRPGMDVFVQLADIGPSPRTSTPSQAPSSHPMPQTLPPQSSTSHPSYPTTREPSGRRFSNGNPLPRSYFQALNCSSPHSSPLNPPSAPFAQESPNRSRSGSQEGNLGRSTSASDVPILGASTSSKTMAGLPSFPSDSSSISLSINYLPSKFSSELISTEARESSARRRRGGGVKGGKGIDLDGVRIPKMGGGREAFRAGESRMTGNKDEDEDEDFLQSEKDGSDSGGDKGSSWAFWKKPSNTENKLITPMPKKTMRWNRFKWILFVCNSMLTSYSAVCLVICLLTWFDAWSKADIIRVGNTTELSISTLASTLGLFTSLVGWAGLLMNNRMFLAIYTFLCWITFIFLVVPGYLTYKKRTFNLEGKINAQWSRALGTDGRLRIQDQLGCCGYFSPFVEATVSQTCYARSLLPGCKRYYIAFEDQILKRWYIAVFSLVPLHVMVMTAGLLCSNHVTYRFGKGMMPKAYRLSLTSMAVIMDQYAQQLTEQYGAEVAADIISLSKSQIPMDGPPLVCYAEDSISSSETSMTKVSPPPF